jgi:WD40 repeat protein
MREVRPAKRATAAAGLLLVLSGFGILVVGVDTRASEPPPAGGERTEPQAGSAVGIRLDALGDPLPNGALARLGTLRLQHGEPIRRLCYSPDGKWIASSSDKNVRVWDVATGKEVRRFEGILGSVAFTPDSTGLITGGLKVCVRDVASGRVTDTLPVTSCRFALSRDGKTLALAAEGGVRVWSLLAKSELRRVPCPEAREIAISPDGATVAVSGEMGLFCIAVATGVKTTLTREWHSRTLSFSPDGKTLATRGTWERVSLWDVATGREQPGLKTTWEERGSLSSFSPDGKVLAMAGGDAPVSLWDVAARRKLRDCQVPSDHVESLAFTPDGQTLVVGNWYGRLRICDVATGKLRMPFQPPPEVGAAIAFRPDGKSLLSTSEFKDFDTAGHAYVWDAATGKVLHHIACPECRGYIDPAPDGSLVVVHTGPDTAQLLKVPSREKLAVVPAGYQSDTFSLSADCKRVATDDEGNGTFSVRDVATGKELRRIEGALPKSTQLSLSPDGTLLASSSPFSKVFVNPRRRTAFKGADGTFRVWDVATGKERWRQGELRSGHFAFSPDGKWIATSRQSDSEESSASTQVQLWDAATGREVWVGEKHSEPAQIFAFTTDGRMLATGDRGGGVCLWEVGTGKVRRAFRAHEQPIWSLSFSPESGRLATLGFEQTALVWDLAQPPARLSATEAEAEWEALISTDGERSYAAMRRLAADPEQAVRLMRQRLRPVAAPERELLTRLLAELDSDRFAAREQAEKALSGLGDAAAPDLRRALQAKPSPESARRLQRALDGMDGWSGERLRAWRALEVLEHIGTADARRVLQTVADGLPAARFTLEAKASLRRLAGTAAGPATEPQPAP